MQQTASGASAESICSSSTGPPLRGAQFWHPPGSRLLRRLRRPVDRFNPELLSVLGVQSLPGAELHGLRPDHAAEGSSAEKVIEHIETNVPPRSAHCDEAVTDVGPQ